jgi:hypothetical protein
MCLISLDINYFIGTGLSDEQGVRRMTTRGFPSLRVGEARPNKGWRG